MNENILVVDDEKEIVDAIEFYLKTDGYNILKTYDGLQSLEMIIENDIKLVIMDVMMPNMDDLKTTMKIREDKNIPIILLSAKSEGIDKILELLLSNQGRIFSSYELYERVREEDAYNCE